MANPLAALAGELLGYVVYGGPDTMMAGQASSHNPILVRAQGRLPRREGALALNDSGVIGQVSWDGREPRLAHLLYFDDWTLANAHFDAWNCAQTRLESARLLVNALRGAPTAVVMGDLNCQPDEPPIAHFRQAGYTLAQDSLPPEVDRRTFHKFTGQGIVELDYILLRGAAVQQAMIPRPRREAPFLSDHDPLVADIVLAPRA
jgi:endonuclease/exonuclease/phosphatase family metal-dependent hydrolase